MIKEPLIILASIVLVYIGGLTALEPGHSHAFDKNMYKKVDLSDKLYGSHKGQHSKELYEKKRWRHGHRR